MKNKIIKLIVSIIFIFSASCSKKPDPAYILSSNPSVQKLEERDHKFCVALKLNIDGKENYRSPYYWSCRLSFAKYRLALKTQDITPQQSQRNFDFESLVQQITPKIIGLSQSFILEENIKLDEVQHKKCLSLGFTFETDDQAKIDKYFLCRKSLIEEENFVPPFGNQAYLKYPNKDYNMTFVLNRRIETSINAFDKAYQEYPTCKMFHPYSENFKRCSSAEDSSRKCYSEIRKKVLEKEWEEKIHCQKQAYVRYGDELLKKDYSREKEIAKRNYTSDYYNNNNFAALGLNPLDFISEDEEAKAEEERKRKEREEEIKRSNSKLELYNKYEITKLRRNYIRTCQIDSNKKIDAFVKDLKDSCEKLKEFDELGK